MDEPVITYTPDPGAIQLFDLYYQMCRLEFFAAVTAMASAFIVGILIWNLIVTAKNEKRIW